MIVYKYISSRYADDFANGIVKISPAHTFRQADGFDDGRADPNELRKQVALQGGGTLLNSTDNPILNEFYTIIKAGKRVENFEIEVIGEFAVIVDNALLCCFSALRNPIIDERMKDTFDSDSVFEISDIAMFGKIITDEVFSADTDFKHGLVQYSDKPYEGREDYTKVNHFRKRKAYSWQMEYRLIWSLEDIPEPFVINVPSLSGLVKRVQ